MIWFPFYSSDFIGATVGLSCQEVSLYNWMLTLYYELGPFPTDHVRTYRIVRCESDEQKRTVDYLLQNFFILREDGWYQERAEKEKIKFAQIHQEAVERGKRSAEVRREKYGSAQPVPRKPFESLSKASGNASEPTTTTSTTTSIATTKEKQKDMATAVAVAEKRQQVSKEKYELPDCPYETLVDLYHETLPMLPKVAVLSDARKRHLKARWRQSCADDNYTLEQALDWWRWFFQKVAASKFLTGKTKPNGDRKPFAATIDFLIDAEKFVRIYEGRYD